MYFAILTVKQSATGHYTSVRLALVAATPSLGPPRCWCVSRETDPADPEGYVFHVKRAASDDRSFHVKQANQSEEMFHVKQEDRMDRMFHVKQMI